MTKYQNETVISTTPITYYRLTIPEEEQRKQET